MANKEKEKLEDITQSPLEVELKGKVYKLSLIHI